MYIEEEFLNIDFEDPRLHLKEMMKTALTTMQNLHNINKINYYDAVDTYSALIEFCNIYGIDCNFLQNNKPNSPADILRFLNEFYLDIVYKNTTLHYNDIFSKKVYSLSDNEYATIQQNINTLRDKINNSKDFTDEHRDRLLKKLEELQKEIHKKMSSYDKILGNVVSIGHTLGRTTKEAEPFIHEVKEILKIIFKSKETTENLPDTSTQLATNDFLQIGE